MATEVNKRLLIQQDLEWPCMHACVSVTRRDPTVNHLEGKEAFDICLCMDMLSCCTGVAVCNYPARACASKGLCDRSWCLLYIIYLQNFFLSFKILTFRRPFQHRKASLRI